jgi:DNA-binding transcriptional LysR family regulator
MEMHQIRYFLTVSETLNLAKAAERCNVAQPSLTRGIKTHEAVGELIRRERNLSHLTELGQRIVPMLRQCYETAVSAKSCPVDAQRRSGLALTGAVAYDWAQAARTNAARAFSGVSRLAAEIASGLTQRSVRLPEIRNSRINSIARNEFMLNEVAIT